MFTLTAKFSSRTVTRNSKKAFPFAWLAVNQQKTLTQVQSGFSSTRVAAERSARAYGAGMGGTNHTEVVEVQAVEV